MVRTVTAEYTVSMTECWLPIPYEPFGSAYHISNFGRVKVVKPRPHSNSKSIYLKTSMNGTVRYQHVTLYSDKLRKNIYIHRAVAIAFLGNPPHSRSLVCHIDGNRANNHASNLVWGDAATNMQDKVRHGNSLKGVLNKAAKLTEKNVLDIRLRYELGKISQTELAKLYGVHQSIISDIVRHETWKHI